MCPATCDFSWDNLSLPVSDASLYHVADIDPEIEWDKMGLKSHEKDQEADEALDDAAKQAEEFLQTQSGQEKLNSFLTDTVSNFKAISQKTNGLKRLFPDTKFIFVVGPMRTGGSYLLNELLTMLDLNRRDFLHRMIGDGIPSLKHSLFWNIPPNYISFLFEMAQFLQWVKERWPREDYVVKKRTCFGNALPLIDEIFGEQAHYLLTVRHPCGIAESTQDFFETYSDGTTTSDSGWDLLMEHRFGLPRDKWEAMNHDERVLHYWKNFYVDVGKTKKLKGELTPVVFNRDSERVAREIAGDLDIDHEPDAFTPSDRSFGDFWDSDEVADAIETVRSAWDIYDREWPGPDRL